VKEKIRIKCYSHQVGSSIKELTFAQRFACVHLAECTANNIAQLLGVKATGSFSGTMQCHDEVIVDELSEEMEELIKAAFPFVNINKRWFA
jgi:hypothetical protein